MLPGAAARARRCPTGSDYDSPIWAGKVLDQRGVRSDALTHRTDEIRPQFLTNLTTEQEGGVSLGRQGTPAGPPTAHRAPIMLTFIARFRRFFLFAGVFSLVINLLLDRAGDLHAAGLRPRHDEPQPRNARHAHRVHGGGAGGDGRTGLRPLSAPGARGGRARQDARSHRVARDAGRSQSTHARRCAARAAGRCDPAGVPRRRPDPGALRHPVDSGLHRRHQSVPSAAGIWWRSSARSSC